MATPNAGTAQGSQGPGAPGGPPASEQSQLATDVARLRLDPRDAKNSHIEVSGAGGGAFASKEFGDFKGFGLRDELVDACALKEPTPYTKPSKIQGAVLSVINKQEQKNIIAQAHTGSGKTGMFSLSILNVVDEKKATPQAVVICPTKELVDQAVAEVESLGQKIQGLRVRRDVVLKQKKKKKKRPKKPPPYTEQVIVGTVGRLKNTMGNPNTEKKNIKFIVLDEADLLLENEYEKVESIIKNIREDAPSVRIILVSATFPEESAISAISGEKSDDYKKMAKAMLRKRINEVVGEAPIEFRIKQDESDLKNIKQYAVECKTVSERLDALLNILRSKKTGQVIVFVNTNVGANDLYNKLVEKKFSVALMAGAKLTDDERKEAVKNFAKGSYKVLVATNVLSRGFNDENVRVVVNFDISGKPHGEEKGWKYPGRKGGAYEKFWIGDPENYARRIGRCGRFGRKGVAISIYTKLNETDSGHTDNSFFLLCIEKDLDLRIPRIQNTPEAIDGALGWIGDDYKCCSGGLRQRKKKDRDHNSEALMATPNAGTAQGSQGPGAPGGPPASEQSQLATDVARLRLDPRDAKNSHIEVSGAGGGAFASKEFGDFKGFGLRDELVDACALKEPTPYTKPSKIQGAVLSVINKQEQKNIIAQAHTGSGKTGMFSLSILNVVDEKKATPQAVVICPTKELVDQAVAEVESLGQKIQGLRVRRDVVLKQKKKKKKRPKKPPPYTEQVIVGTVGRLKNTMGNPNTEKKNIKFIVLDEADLLLENEYEKVESIIKNIREDAPSVRIILVSATFPEESAISAISGEKSDDYKKMAKAMLRKRINEVVGEAPIEFRIKQDESDLKNIKQYAVECKTVSERLDALLNILRSKKTGQVIVFVNTNVGANDLYNKLVEKKFSVALMAGAKLTDDERKEAVKNFAKGSYKVLVATNVLSRGFNDENVRVVVNFDISGKPHGEEKGWKYPGRKGGAYEKFWIGDPENYARRIGRCGRFGRKGVAISIYTKLNETDSGHTDNSFFLLCIEKDLDLRIPRIQNTPEAIDDALGWIGDNTKGAAGQGQ